MQNVLEALAPLTEMLNQKEVKIPISDFPKEVQEKIMREQEYIVSKIREYKHQQRMISGQKSITGLPATIEKPFH